MPLDSPSRRSRAGDEEAGDDEEDVDADEAAGRFGQADVEEHHGDDRHGAETLDVGPEVRPAPRLDRLGLALLGCLREGVRPGLGRGHARRRASVLPALGHPWLGGRRGQEGRERVLRRALWIVGQRRIRGRGLVSRNRLVARRQAALGPGAAAPRPGGGSKPGAARAAAPGPAAARSPGAARRPSAAAPGPAAAPYEPAAALFEPAAQSLRAARPRRRLGWRRGPRPATPGPRRGQEDRGFGRGPRPATPGPAVASWVAA